MSKARKNTQTKPHSSTSATSSKSNESTIEIRSKIFVSGFSVHATPNELMKDLDEGMKGLVLGKINKVFGSQLTEEDLPVTGDDRRVVYIGHNLPDDYQSSTVRELFPDKSRVVVHYSPHPERIIQTRNETQERLLELAADETQALLDSNDSELTAMKTELEYTKKEFTAQGIRLKLALGENVTKSVKKQAMQPPFSEMDKLLATMEAMMEEKLKCRDEAWGMKLKRQDEAWGMKLKCQDEDWGTKLRCQDEDWGTKLRQVELELEREKEERRLGDEKLFKIIRPLRLRILLEKTRNRFCKDLSFKSWSDLLKHKPVEDYVIANLQDPRRPSDDAIRWCFQNNNPVREAGNDSAHEAKDQDVWEAVLNVPDESEERKHLSSLFTYAYQGAQVK